MAVGEKTKGTIFVAGAVKSVGEIEVKPKELDFIGSDPPLILKYKDVQEAGGDLCAVRVTNIALSDELLESSGGLDKKCCLGVTTKSGSVI